MSADPRRIAPGHSRLMRVVEVNEPTAPDPLDGLVFRIYGYQVEILMCLALKDAFGRVLTYCDLAVAAWGDTPQVRADSDNRQTQRVLRHHIMALNKRLAKHDEPFAVVNVRGKGYKLTDRASAPTVRPRHHSAADRVRIVAVVARLRAEHPEWTKEAVFERAGVCRQSYNTWRVRYPHLFTEAHYEPAR